jgi:hypothetical protein
MVHKGHHQQVLMVTKAHKVQVVQAVLTVM